MSKIELADVTEDIEKDDLRNRFLTFHLGEESYGIEISQITEIIVMQQITKVPDLPESIIGVVNLRGKVISVMDMRKRFHLQSREYDDRTCIIVVDINSISIGLVVDTVSEVLTIEESQISPPPAIHSGIKNNYVMGLGKVGREVKILLNIDKIFYDEEFERVQQIQ